MIYITDLKTTVSNNKKKLLGFIICLSVIYSIISIILNEIGVNLINIGVLLFLNFIMSAYFAYSLRTDFEKISVKSFLKMVNNYKNGILSVAFFQGVCIIVWLLLIKMMSMIKYTLIFIQPLSIVFYVILNCLNFQLLFEIFEKQNITSQKLKQSLRILKTNHKTLIYLIIKTVSIILIGSIITYLVNIFIYAPQIDSALKTMSVIDESVLNPYFSTSLSNFIQSFGAQVISGIILIWIGSACTKS